MHTINHSAHPHQRLIQQQERRATDKLHSQGQTALLSPAEGVRGQLEGDCLQPYGGQDGLG